jgi:IS30 family transposase
MRKLPPGSPCSVCLRITDAQQVALQQARTAGHSLTQLAREFPFSRSAIYRHLRAHHNERPIEYNARANYERERALAQRR